MDTTSAQGMPNLPTGPARNNTKIIRWALGAAVVVFMLLVGALPWAFTGLVETGFAALLAGTLLGVLPVPLYLALALFLDRYEKEPIWMLAGAFLWGATIANFFSYLFNSIFIVIAGSLFGAGAAFPLAAVISAPITEEGSKGLALLILFLWKKDEFDNVIDGIVYAAMVGLGFAMVENFAYYGRALAEGGLISGFLTFGVRGVASPFMHPIFTAMTGIGLGLARQSSKRWVKVVAPIAGLLAAMMLHSFWNFMATVIDPAIEAQFQYSSLTVFVAVIFLLTLVKAVPLLLGVLLVVFFGLRREGRIVRRNLTPELESGLITQQEYAALGSVGGRLGSSFRALSSGGLGGWRAYSRFSQIATELAFHRDRVQRGITSVDTASREAAYVQTLRELRARS